MSVADWLPAGSRTDPSSAVITPTESDSVNDPNGPFRAFYVDVAGSIKFTDLDGNDVTFAGCAAGTIYPIGVLRFWTTTAATVFGLR